MKIKPEEKNKRIREKHYSTMTHLLISQVHYITICKPE